MDNKDKLIEEILKDMQPRVVNITIKHLLNNVVTSLIKILLLMRKTPNQAETLINDIVEKLGFEGEKFKLFENLTDKEKIETLNEVDYVTLLNLSAIGIVKDLVKEEKNGK